MNSLRKETRGGFFYNNYIYILRYSVIFCEDIKHAYCKRDLAQFCLPEHLNNYSLVLYGRLDLLHKSDVFFLEIARVLLNDVSEKGMK